MERAITHVHVGPSPLALGLPVLITHSLPGVRVHLVGRPGEPDRAFYQRTVYLRDGTSHHDPHIPVASFTGPRADDVPSHLRTELADSPLVLITVSLRDRIRERVQFIKALVDAAGSDSEVVFIACENDPTPVHRELSRRIGSSVIAVEAIVDRVCTWPDLSERAPVPRHVVHHEIGEWILRRPDRPSRVVDLLAQAGDVTVADPDCFRAYRDRKSWMVNGLHLDLAIRGRAHNEADLRRLVSDEVAQRKAEETLTMMTEAYRIRHERSVPPGWAEDRLRVVAQLPDSSDRILRGLDRRDLQPFIEGVGRKIGDPARTAATQGKVPPSMQQMARDLGDMLADLEQYPGWSKLKAGELSEDRDEKAIVAFEGALAGWASRDTVGHEARRLRRQLLGHRRLLARRVA